MDGKLYLCAVKDVWSNRIVGYSMADRMTGEHAVVGLRHAVSDRSPAGTVVHSDRRSQCRSSVYVSTLKSTGLKGSMGRVGAPDSCTAVLADDSDRTFPAFGSALTPHALVPDRAG